jgi:hypothetical protein
MYCFNWPSGRIAGAVVPCRGTNFGKRLRDPDANFEIGHRAARPSPNLPLKASQIRPTEAQKTESNRRCRQHDFQVHRSSALVRAGKQSGYTDLRSRSFKYDLVGPARGALPIVFTADSPGE